MSKHFIPYFVFPLAAVLFTAATGCDDSIPKPSGSDPMPSPIDSNMARLSVARNYTNGELITTEHLIYVGEELSGIQGYAYLNGVIADSALTEITYEGEDIVILRKSWESGAWSPFQRIRHSYSSGRLVSRDWENFNNGTWTNSSRYEYIYENNEFRQEIEYTLDNGGLSPSLWYTYTYANGRTVQVNTESINNGQMQVGSQSVFNYEGSDLSLIEIYGYSETDEEFLLSGREDFVLGPNGLLSRTRYTYDEDTETYNEFISNMYTYDADGRLLSHTLNIIIGSEYETVTEYEYEPGAGNYSEIYSEPSQANYLEPIPN